MGDETIEARVREVQTKLGAEASLRAGDLPLKEHERVFFERVPLSPERRSRIQLTDEWRFVFLATLIESWGYRASLDRQHLMSREEAADAWFTEEFEPIAEVPARLRPRRLGHRGRALPAHRDAAVPPAPDAQVDRRGRRAPAGEMRAPAVDDTVVHQILKEMR